MCDYQVWDIRHARRELVSWQGHSREVSCVAWHPTALNLLASGESFCNIVSADLCNTLYKFPWSLHYKDVNCSYCNLRS